MAVGKKTFINMKYPFVKSSVAVKDASEIKKNENSAKVPITKVQKKVRLMRVMSKSILMGYADFHMLYTSEFSMLHSV